MKTGKLLCMITLSMGLLALSGCGEQTYKPKLPTSEVESNIYVEKIEGISDDFIRGVDISSIIAEEQSGVVYYNEAGEIEDIFKVLADAGVNYVRVRVWNDPYDSNGNGYGGGNNDTQKAIEIGKRAAAYGMKLYVDYHYSDFWADPKKQEAPKAWQDMTVEQKAQAAYEFTKDSLNQIVDCGADVGIVQLGNETTKGMCGQIVWRDICDIMKGGSKAVREISQEKEKDIKIAVHFTNPEQRDEIIRLADKLVKHELDYDIFALSYYPYWHGTLDNLQILMTTIINDYGKQVLIAETAYAYTLEEGDGQGNSVSEKDLMKDYTASIQSQATAIRDVMATVAASGENALGIFYWEPAWIPVREYHYDATDADEVLAYNRERWEQFGSGWASSYATEYDPKDAGKYYGGSSWDNQALFDFDGHPLASLNVFKYVKYGATTKLAVDFYEEKTVILNVDAEVVMPQSIYVTYNNRSLSGEIPVTWNQDEVSKIDTSNASEYVIHGVLDDGQEVVCNVKVMLLNWIQNASFEDSDSSMWSVKYEGSNPTDIQKKESDACTGPHAFHYWNEDKVEFSLEQTITGLEDGRYSFEANIQGGDSGDSPVMYIYIQNGDKQEKQEFVLDGWCNWQTPKIEEFTVSGGTVTIGVYIKAAGGAWGTMDDFYLCKLK